MAHTVVKKGHYEAQAQDMDAMPTPNPFAPSVAKKGAAPVAKAAPKAPEKPAPKAAAKAKANPFQKGPK